MGITQSMLLDHKRIKLEIKRNKHKSHTHISIGLRIYPEEIQYYISSNSKCIIHPEDILHMCLKACKKKILWDTIYKIKSKIKD